MTTYNFSSLELSKILTDAGFPPDQAEAAVKAIEKAQHELVTKTDLELALVPLKSDLLVLKWMMGATVAGVIAQVLKTFF